jgi:hypothetical protein
MLLPFTGRRISYAARMSWRGVEEGVIHVARQNTGMQVSKPI